MQELKKRIKLNSYKILAYSLQGKQNLPRINIICEKNNIKFMVKSALNNNLLSEKIISKEYHLLRKRYDNILNPSLLNSNTLITKYLPYPSLSCYMNNIFNKDKYVKKSIKWLVDFHNEKHRNGIGHIHGDFSAHEIVISKNKLIIFDWEDYEEENEQLIDIFYFIFRNTYQNTIIGSKEKDIFKFINSLIGNKDKLHPHLKIYLKLRKNIKYNKNKRKKAFELFLKQRIKRENKYYTIPRKDRFIYREMLKKLESI